MHNIILILKREYFTRVKSKSFLMTTFLAPIGLILVMAFLIFLISRGSDTIKTIAVIDNAGIRDSSDTSINNLRIDYSYTDLPSAIAAYRDKKFSGVIELPPIVLDSKNYDINFHADEQLAIDESMSIKKLFRDRIKKHKINQLGIDASQLDLIDPKITIDPKTVDDKEKEMSSLTSKISSSIGAIVGYALFFIIFIYGNQVMHSVTEEKRNRIVEVLISSVKPFELMMGKVIGVGLVGLTQISIWAILLGIISLVGMNFIPSPDPDMLGATPDMLSKSKAFLPDDMVQVTKELLAINWFKIVPLYFFYFIIGYFTYAALFAAIGSAVGDNIQEAQVLVTIGSLPLIIASYIAISAVKAPNSSLAVWSSMLPFTAPVVMPVRLPIDPPSWQILVSILVSIIASILLIYIAARIYRMGILMYGKKASFGEILKWMVSKG